MKLKITVEYSNVDEPWLEWWLAKYGEAHGIDIENPEFPHEARLKDETSDVVSVMTIELDAPESEKYRSKV